MEFSYSDYQNLLSRNAFHPPCGFAPYFPVDKIKYRKMEKEHEKKENCCSKAFGELHKRVGGKYFWEVYPTQSRMLDYAQLSFPAYKFVLPEIITDDWLAIVDWHKFHRDHALHQPLTAYVVSKLLGFGNKEESFEINGVPLLNLCVDEMCKWDGTKYLKEYLLNTRVLEGENKELWLDKTCSKELWKAIFIEAAYLAAVFHDMGYPWRYVNILTSKLEYSGYPQIDAPSENTDNIIHKFGQRLLFCPLNGYRLLDRNTPSTWHYQLKVLTSKALRETHGLPGALEFLHFNDVLREFPNIQYCHPIRQFCIEWAAMAIMMHDMSKIYWGKDLTESPPENPHLRLRFDVDPLGCIITLADVLEDFERPVVEFSPANGGSYGNYENNGCEFSSLEYSNNQLIIKYKMASPKHGAQKKSYIKKDCKEYFDTNEGYVDLSACGVNHVDMKPIF
jgi:hypothetical protein